MIDRSAFVAACLAFLVFASLPVGAYVGASSTGSSASLEPDAEILDSLACLPAPVLEGITMNAYQQEAESLQTASGTVASTSDGPEEGQETFRIESGMITASTICFSGSDDERESVELQLNDAEFEDTELVGPWTDIEFGAGEADTMTVVLPPEEVLSLLVQIPGSINVIETILDLFDIEPDDEVESRLNDADGEDDRGDGDGGGDSPTNDTTDGIDDTTDAVNDTVDNTTDTVDDTVDNTTDTVDDTVDNTTDTVDDTVDNTTDAVDDTVDNTTDTVDDTADNTTDAVDDTVDDTTDVVDDTTDGALDNTTDAVDDTVDNTTGLVGGAVETTTDVVGGLVAGTVGRVGGSSL